MNNECDGNITPGAYQSTIIYEEALPGVIPDGCRDSNGQRHAFPLRHRVTATNAFRQNKMAASRKRFEASFLTVATFANYFALPQPPLARGRFGRTPKRFGGWDNGPGRKSRQHLGHQIREQRKVSTIPSGGNELGSYLFRSRFVKATQDIKLSRAGHLILAGQCLSTGFIHVCPGSIKWNWIKLFSMQVWRSATFAGDQFDLSRLLQIWKERPLIRSGRRRNERRGAARDARELPETAGETSVPCDPSRGATDRIRGDPNGQRETDRQTPSAAIPTNCAPSTAEVHFLNGGRTRNGPSDHTQSYPFLLLSGEPFLPHYHFDDYNETSIMTRMRQTKTVTDSTKTDERSRSGAAFLPEPRHGPVPVVAGPESAKNTATPISSSSTRDKSARCEILLRMRKRTSVSDADIETEICHRERPRIIGNTRDSTSAPVTTDNSGRRECRRKNEPLW